MSQNSVNSSPPGQNGRHFADDIFKRFFLNGNVRISVQFSLKFVPKGPIDNKSALVQVMACRLYGAKPLSEPMLTQFTDAYMRHQGEMSWRDLPPWNFVFPTWRQWGCRPHLNTLRLRQNVRHLADDIFKGIFWNENIWILNDISLNHVP